MTTQTDENWLNVLCKGDVGSERETNHAAAFRQYLELQARDELMHPAAPQIEGRLLTAIREQNTFEDSAIQTAQIIVAKLHEQGEAITQLKLQKLLYYAQGWSKALLNRWRFDECVEAWIHGPVVFSVRQKYACFGRGPITLDAEIFPPDDFLIDTVLNVYGKYGAEELVALTHKDTPWQKNFIPMEDRVLIPNDDIEHFFSRGEALQTRIHARFFDTYRERKYDIREWTPPNQAGPDEIAEIKGAIFK